MIYGERSNGNHHGTVYTNREVVDFILDLCLEKNERLTGKVIVEPSAGDGAFLVPIIERIQKECANDLGTIAVALRQVHVYELDKAVIPRLIENAKRALLEPSLLECLNISIGDYLLARVPKADIIIGNPPYVRYDNVPVEQKEHYKRLFTSFTGRSDIYVPFIEKSLKSLKENGRVGFICADRWINNQYGKTLRKIIHHNFYLKYFIKFSGYNPFQEEVIAYPSVFLVVNEQSHDEIFFSELESAESLNAARIQAISRTYKFNEDSEIEYDDLHTRYLSLEQQGFKIGIGVATGADKVFVVDGSVDIEPEILVPLISRKDFVGNSIRWRGTYLVNTFSSQGGGLVDLDRFPRLRTYLDSHAEHVLKRHVAKKSETAWYRLIDPVHKDLLKTPKLLIPDISTRKAVIFDKGDFYPHHNLYYITAQDTEKLLVLRSFLVSDFCTRQVAQKGVLMNGGALRWQAQTLLKLYLPDLDTISLTARQELISLYESGDFSAIDDCVAGIVSDSKPVALV